jgi:hypothetical protein
MIKTLIRNYSSIPLGLLIFANTAYAETDPNLDHTEENRKIAQEFMQKLAGTLKQQIESSGTASAITVCKEVAPALAAQYSTDQRLVKRVSLKPRNQSLGVASDVERKLLQRFDEKQRDGETGLMELTTIYQDANGSWLQYMRAIPTQPQCLQCHGSTEDIAPNVRARLSEEYPADLATGYRVGEIRGAVSIRHKLQ